MPALVGAETDSMPSDSTEDSARVLDVIRHNNAAIETAPVMRFILCLGIKIEERRFTRKRVYLSYDSQAITYAISESCANFNPAVKIVCQT